MYFSVQISKKYFSLPGKKVLGNFHSSQRNVLKMTIPKEEVTSSHKFSGITHKYVLRNFWNKLLYIF